MSGCHVEMTCLCFPDDKGRALQDIDFMLRTQSMCNCFVYESLIVGFQQQKRIALLFQVSFKASAAIVSEFDLRKRSLLKLLLSPDLRKRFHLSFNAAAATMSV